MAYLEREFSLQLHILKLNFTSHPMLKAILVACGGGGVHWAGWEILIWHGPQPLQAVNTRPISAPSGTHNRRGPSDVRQGGAGWHRR